MIRLLSLFIFSSIFLLASGTHANASSLTITSPDRIRVHESHNKAAYTITAIGGIGKLTYAISRWDKNLFNVNRDTGEVSFKNAPDFEAPQDGNANNVYVLWISVTDTQGNTAGKPINVKVTDDIPVITSEDSVTCPEYTYDPVYIITATDDDNLTYSISGWDSKCFNVNTSNGEVAFKASPDFNNPQDANGNNVYVMWVSAKDDNGNIARKAITIKVTNDRPDITSPERVDYMEGDSKTAYKITAEDNEPSTLTYHLSGWDSKLFTVYDNGEIFFLSPPEFDNPLDENANNVYILWISVTDADGNITGKPINIKVIKHHGHTVPILGGSHTQLVVDTMIVNTMGQLLMGDPHQAKGSDHSHGNMSHMNNMLSNLNHGDMNMGDEHDHGGDPKKMNEHMALMNLVQDQHATHITIRSGDWHDPAIWNVQNVPGDGARVIISKNHTIQVRRVHKDKLMTIRVDGTLQMAAIHSVTARLIFDDYNNGFETSDASSPDYDPTMQGQGLIALGNVAMCGAYRKPYEIMGGVSKGQDFLFLGEVPDGWQIGDKLVITGTWVGGTSGHEVVEIAALRSTGVKLHEPLTNDHLLPAHGTGAILNLHVANLTRNVVVETAEEDRALNSRGHIMFMHSNRANICHTAFNHLGRTDKKKQISNTQMDEEGNITRIGSNQLARYALHFHRAGMGEIPALVEGCVVNNSPGWGYVNHSSHVRMLNNVAFDIVGAAYNTEAGDELGSFINNLAIHMPGGKHSHGSEGIGFWLFGKAVTLKGNIVSGAKEAGYKLWNGGSKPMDGADDRMLPVKLVPRPLDYGPLKEIHPRWATAIFDDNIAYNCTTGLRFGWWGIDTPGEYIQHVRGFLAWHVTNGIWRTYSPAVINGVTLIGDTKNYLGRGLDNGNGSFVRHLNLNIEGFQYGLHGNSHEQGGSSTINARFKNVIDVQIAQHPNRDGITRLVGDVRFYKPSSTQLNGRTYSKIKIVKGRHSNVKPDNIYVKGKNYFYLNIKGQGLKMVHMINEHKADYVLYQEEAYKNHPRLWLAIKAHLRNKTNAQMLAETGTVFNKFIWDQVPKAEPDMPNIHLEKIDDYFQNDNKIYLYKDLPVVKLKPGDIHQIIMADYISDTEAETIYVSPESQDKAIAEACEKKEENPGILFIEAIARGETWIRCQFWDKDNAQKRRHNARYGWIKVVVE